MISVPAWYGWLCLVMFAVGVVGTAAGLSVNKYPRTKQVGAGYDVFMLLWCMGWGLTWCYWMWR